MTAPQLKRTKAEADFLYKVGANKWGICRDGAKLTIADIARYCEQHKSV